MKTIAWCFIGLIIIAAVTGFALRLLVSNTIPTEVKLIRAISKKDFFDVGKYGHTLILEVNTERTDGKTDK